MIASALPESIANSFDKIRADYDMTRSNRFVRRRTGVNPIGTGADYHFRNQTSYYDAIEQARDMDRNDAVIGILADRRVDNIVQQGFTLDPKTGDKGLDALLYSKWIEETEDPDKCDIAGELTWKEIERHVCRAESIDGDIVVCGTKDGQFQTIEAHLIQTDGRIDNTFLGVTTDSYGKRIEYHIREELSEFGQKGMSRPIKVRDEKNVRQLFHVYNPKRVTATRGVTQLAPIFSYAGMLEDINFANLVKQQVVSCFAILREFPAGSGGNPSTITGYGETDIELTSTRESRTTEGVSPGMEINGLPGEKLSGFSPNIPGSSYFEQAKMMLQIIGVNFGLPLCLVLMDGSETNFSGWRGAVDEARKGFVADQLNLVRRLNTPAYRWKVSRWIETDREIRRWSEKVDIYKHNWNLPTWNYIEPVADAQGDAEQLKNCLTSPRRLHAARGKDWEEVSEEIVADNSYAIEVAMKKADEVNSKSNGQPQVSWRDLLPLPMANGQTLALQDPAAIEAQQSESSDLASTDQINVAATALNGAQVTSLVDVITQVGTGAIPKDSAIAIIGAAFPTMSIDEIRAIIDPIVPGSISADGVPTGQAGQSQQQEPEKAGAEMIGVKRSDWKNSRKAINDILKELADKTISEQRARLELDSLGVTPSKIDVYIKDVLGDGTVDTPELQDA